MWEEDKERMVLVVCVFMMFVEDIEWLEGVVEDIYWVFEGVVVGNGINDG